MIDDVVEKETGLLTIDSLEFNGERDQKINILNSKIIPILVTK